MAKVFAAGTVLLAVGLPVALAGTAGAATASPSITCSQVSSSLGAACGVLPVVTVGNTIAFNVFGSNFAFDNGPVTGTTTAAGATVSITETSTSSAQVVVSTSGTTVPGYYGITLKDDSGSATFATAFGVDPQLATVTSVSPSTVPQGSVTLVTVTGTGLLSGNPSSDASNATQIHFANGSAVSADGTTYTFYVDTLNYSTPAGGYTIDLPGGLTVGITVTGANITAIAPSGGLVVPSAGTSTQTVTITGTGFSPSAVVTIAGSSTYPNEPFGNTDVIIGSPTVVNSTTITAPVTIQYGISDAATQWTVKVQNPDGTYSTAVNGLGFREAGAAVVASTPSLTFVSGTFHPGLSTVYVTGDGAFPIATGAVVTLSYGGFSFSGTVVGYDASGNAEVQMYIPKYLSTTLTSSIAAGVTSLPVASIAGIASGTALTFADSTLDTTTASGTVASTSSVTVLATADAHASGTVVEFPTSGVAPGGWTLSVNNGSSTQILLGQSVTAGSGATFTFIDANGQSSTPSSTLNLAPGTYTVYLTDPGVNFTTGSKITFFNTATGANGSNITGTIVSTGKDTATVVVTMPATGTGTATATTTLYAQMNAGQNYVNLTSDAGLSAGSSFTVAASPGQLNSETFTIASSWNPATWYPESQSNTEASGSTTTVVLGSAPANAIPVGGTIANGAVSGTISGYNASTMTVTETGGNFTGLSGAVTITGPGSLPQPIPLTSSASYTHAALTTVSVLSSAQPTSGSYDAVISNGSGQADIIPFANLVASSASLTGITDVSGPTGTTMIVGSGASNVTVYILGTFNTSLSAADYVATSTTPGVTFGSVTGVSSTYITTSVSVAAGTPVNTNVEYTVSALNGSGSGSLPDAAQASSGFSIGIAPTVSAVSAMSTLLNGETATFTVTGTGFDANTSASFLATTGDTAGMVDSGTAFGNDGNGLTTTCTVVSSTLLSCTVSVGSGSVNGPHSLIVTNGEYGTSAPFANALTISAPTVGAVSPTSFQDLSTSPPFVLSGLTGFTVSQTTTPDAYYNVINAYGVEVGGGFLGQTTYVGPNSVSVNISGATRPAGGLLVITLVQNVQAFGGDVYADAPAISLGQPLAALPTGASIVSGQSGVVTILSPNTDSYVFMPGATVSAVNPGTYTPAAGITVASTTVLPGIITTTVSVAAGVAAGTYDLEVINPDGGIAYSSFVVTVGPFVTSVNGVATVNGPVSFLNGSTETLTIDGGNFVTGAVVTASGGVATFGASTVNGAGTVLTVSATFASFSGASPLSGTLTVTNPGVGGSVSVANELQVNPTPTTTGGPYFVPTFTTNTEFTITGTGFQAGLTATSSNANYTVSVASVTPTSVTLLVSTNSNATSGTSSTITLTNPDGGTTTFVIHGGPKLAPPKVFRITRIIGRAIAGRVVSFVIRGTGFYAQPRILSNAAGTRAVVSRDTGTVLIVRVFTRAHTKARTYTFTVILANGQSRKVNYAG